MNKICEQIGVQMHLKAHKIWPYEDEDEESFDLRPRTCCVVNARCSSEHDVKWAETQLATILASFDPNSCVGCDKGTFFAAGVANVPIGMSQEFDAALQALVPRADISWREILEDDDQ